MLPCVRAKLCAIALIGPQDGQILEASYLVRVRGLTYSVLWVQSAEHPTLTYSKTQQEVFVVMSLEQSHSTITIVSRRSCPIYERGHSRPLNTCKLRPCSQTYEVDCLNQRCPATE